MTLEWTEEKNQRLKKRIKDNIAYPELAKEFGVSTHAVKNQIKRLGWTKKLYIPDTIWTPELTARFIKLLQEGCTSGQICKELGLSRGAVCSKAKRLNHKFVRQPYRKNRKPRQPRSDVNAGALAAKIKVIKGEGEGRGFNGKKVFAWPEEWKVKPPKGIDRFPPPGALLGLDVINLRSDQCRWTFDIKGGTRRVYCKKKQIDERHPYCAAHAALVYEAICPPSPSDTGARHVSSAGSGRKKARRISATRARKSLLQEQGSS